eukprot:2308211-Alexandrium_andersonii.AAC.1
MFSRRCPTSSEMLFARFHEIALVRAASESDDEVACSGCSEGGSEGCSEEFRGGSEGVPRGVPRDSEGVPRGFRGGFAEFRAEERAARPVGHAGTAAPWGWFWGRRSGFGQTVRRPSTCSDP